MSLVNVRASVDLSPLDSVNQVVREAPALMRSYQKIRVRQARVRIRDRFAAPENKPDLPFIWSYDKAAQGRARRWYFANKVPKGSSGGRYQRTGELEANWDVQFIEDSAGGYFQAENDARAALYVYGERQVPSHYLTGWEEADKALQEEAAVMTDQLINDWYFVSTGGRV